MPLQDRYVLRLEPLGAAHDVELDRLAFLEAAEAIRLNSREVNEDVFAILPADETKTLCVVKPLDSTLFHYFSTFLLIFLLRRSDATESGARKVIQRYQLKIGLRSNSQILLTFIIDRFPRSAQGNSGLPRPELRIQALPLLRSPASRGFACFHPSKPNAGVLGHRLEAPLLRVRRALG